MVRPHPTLWLSLLAVAVACGASSFAASPATQPAATQPGVPIVYDPRLGPQPLSADQIRDILAFAHRFGPPGRSVWYVHVHHNRGDKSDFDCAVTIFYGPSQTTRRLRKGQSLYYMPPSRPVTQRQVVPPPGALSLNEYVQVSPAAQPFGKALDIPTPAYWPFDRPAGFTDEEIIDIADFAHTSPAAEGEDGRSAFPYNGNEAIHRIQRTKEGPVEVWSGAQQDLLAGGGTTMKCIKKDGKWVVLETGMWVS